MYERREEVKCFFVNKLCQECYSDMIYTGEIKTTNPPMYVHKCSSNYNHPVKSWVSIYPKIDYERI